jgi:hypothetical protein
MEINHSQLVLKKQMIEHKRMSTYKVLHTDHAIIAVCAVFHNSTKMYPCKKKRKVVPVLN